MTDRIPITNDAGEVAIRHLRQVQKMISVNGRSYVFVVRAGSISLAWVNPDDVNQILSVKGGCCGKKDKYIFVLATEDDVRRWTNNGGR